MEEKEIAERFGINLETIKKEQVKLAKTLEIKDSQDFSNINFFGAIGNIIVQNKIISAIIICNKDYEIIEQQYFFDKLRFPYIHGFRSYRELPSMVEAYNKLSEKPEVIFIQGHGITHPRLGLASHFSIVTGVPTIGITNEIFEETKNEKEDILLEGKKVGKSFLSKEGSNPIFISPGNKITVESAYTLTKSLIKPPHKLPEPLHLAIKYAKEVREELNI
jgi:deoxyribonuclease V